MFAFVVLGVVIKPRDWLERTSPKWFILCWVERKILTQLNSHVVLTNVWVYDVFEADASGGLRLKKA